MTVETQGEVFKIKVPKLSLICDSKRTDLEGRLVAGGEGE